MFVDLFLTVTKNIMFRIGLLSLPKRQFPRLFVLLACIIAAGHIHAADSSTPFNIPRTQTIQISDSNRAYELFVKLPKGYNSDTNKDHRYPVIYITDAMYAFQIVSGATRFPMNSNAMQQAILVGVSWQKGFRGDKSRVRNYTPSIDKSWKKQTGGAARHMTFLQQKVLPYIQQHFRTDPSQRTYVGNSLGGYSALIYC